MDIALGQKRGEIPSFHLFVHLGWPYSPSGDDSSLRDVYSRYLGSSLLYFDEKIHQAISANLLHRVFYNVKK